jgi:hypothetical protein
VNIGILTSTNPQLRDQLEAKGRPDAKAEQVDSAVTAVAAKPRPTGNVAPSTRYPSLRAALDARIAVDLSSGTLTKSDAAVVARTLDDIDNRVGGATRASPQQAARDYLATIERGTLIDRWA